MKTNVFLTMLALSFSLSTFAQATLGDGPGNASQKKICKSLDPRLSAEEIECYPESNEMIIREPKYKYEGKERNLIREYENHPYLDEAKAICKAFGSETGEQAGEHEYSTFWLYGKASIQYINKNTVKLHKQGPTSGPISRLRCQIFFQGVRADKNGNGTYGCYRFGFGSRGERLDDKQCQHGHDVFKVADGTKRCFETFYYEGKEVPYGLSVDMKECTRKPLAPISIL